MQLYNNMKKNRHRVFYSTAAGVLALLMLAASGCRPPDEGDSDAPAINQSDGPLTPFDEMVTITQVKSHNPNITYLDSESKDDNFVSRFYKEKLNLEWKSLWESDPAAYYAKLNLDIASDDLPDAFMCNQQQLNTLIQNGQIMDLTKHYEFYASDKLKDNIESNNKIALKAAMQGDKIYAIPAISSIEGDTPFLWMRTDWMEQLNLSAPETYDDFVRYLTSLKNSGLNAVNGVKSNGWNFYGPSSMAFSAIGQIDGSYYNYWIKDASTGKLVYGSVQPQMKETLRKVQSLFKSGLIDDDYMVKGSTEQELISVGQYGVVFGQYFYPHLLKGSVLNNAKATWKAFPIPKNNEGIYKPKNSLNVSGYYVVRKGYEHPEALLKSLNLWMEIWRADGIYRDWFTDKMTTTHKDVYLCGEYALPSFFDSYNNNVIIGQGIRAAFAAGNPAETIKQQSKLAQFSYSFMADELAANFVSGEGWALKHVYLYAEEVFEKSYKDGFQYDLFTGILSEDGAFTKSSLDRNMDEVFQDIIMGGDLSKFDSFVESWYASGGDKLTEEVNEWYEKNQ